MGVHDVMLALAVALVVLGTAAVVWGCWLYFGAGLALIVGGALAIIYGLVVIET